MFMVVRMSECLISFFGTPMALYQLGIRAACKSSAAPSGLRLRLNWMVMLVWPSEFVDVIESMPAMVENCFSSGVATDDAIAAGLAPESDALTRMVGKSTFGRSLTGSSW